MSDFEILKENSKYRALLLKTYNQSDVYVITFDYLNANRKCKFHDVTIPSYINKKGLNHIVIQTNSNCWYQDESIYEICEAVKKIKYGGIYIAYGSSMGGYAAVDLSRLIDADFVVAFSPQASVDPS